MRQISWQMIKDIVAHRAMIVDQEFTMIAQSNRKLCYSLIRKNVIVIIYFYMFCIHFLLNKDYHRSQDGITEGSYQNRFYYVYIF